MGKTDDKGQTIMHVITEDVDYRIGLYEQDGSLIKLLDPIRFACLATPCSYSTLVQDVDTSYTETIDLETDLTFTTDTFTLIYNDPSQNTNNMSLEVYKLIGTGNILLCTDSSSGYTGVLTCNVSGNTGNLRALGYRTASPTIPIVQLLRTVMNSSFTGTTGLFISFLIFLMMAMIGALFGAIPAIVAGIIGLIPAFVLGSMSLGIVIGLGIMGGIVIHIMKRGQQ